jgi:hypothetical protein
MVKAGGGEKGSCIWKKINLKAKRRNQAKIKKKKKSALAANIAHGVAASKAVAKMSAKINPFRRRNGMAKHGVAKIAKAGGGSGAAGSSLAHACEKRKKRNAQHRRKRWRQRQRKGKGGSESNRAMEMSAASMAKACTISNIESCRRQRTGSGANNGANRRRHRRRISGAKWRIA